MSDWPSQITSPEPPGVIHSFGLSTLVGDAIGVNRVVPAAAVSAANRATYVAFFLERQVTAYKMAWENGATVNGNVDVGIYDENKVKLISSGSVAQSGASVIQVSDITDTVLQPGLYYMALATSSATATFWRAGLGSTPHANISGVAQQETAFPLPSTAAFAAHSTTVPQGFVPALSIMLRSEM